MLNGLDILIARMKTHPEEFWRNGRWTEFLVSVDKHLTEDERKALKQGYTDMARDAFNEVVMKTIAGESVQYDVRSVVELDYDAVMQYPMEQRKAKEQADREHQERQLQAELARMRTRVLQDQALSGLSPYTPTGRP